MFGFRDSDPESRRLGLSSAWENAHMTVLALLYHRGVTQHEWQDLFAAVYKVTSWQADGGEFIFQHLSRDICTYVSEAEQRIRHHIDDAEILRAYICEWEKFYFQVEILPLPFRVCESTKKNQISSSLLQSTLNDSPEKKQLRPVMLDAWRERIFTPLCDRLRSAALRLVDADRGGDIVDGRLVSGVRESFVVLHERDSLEVYQRSFEQHFINNTHVYYKERAGQYLAKHGVQAYMAYADVRLEEEAERARKYLHATPESLQRHLDACTHVLVVGFMEQLLAECALLIKAANIPKLQQLYRMLKRTPSGMETVVKCLDEFIRSEGSAEMRAAAPAVSADPEKFVAALLQLYERYSALVRDAFSDDPQLLTTRDKAFELIVNDTAVFNIDMATIAQRRSGRMSLESKCPELLANFCDLLLRKSQLSKKLSSDQIDAKLDSLLLVLKYVKNKDVFMRFHKAHLSRRLMMDTSADGEKEEQMVVRLRECGMPADHINKLYRMLQDIELNKTLTNQIRKKLRETNGPSSADLISVKILNAGAWGRSGERIHVSLPRQLEDLLPSVESHYRKQHNGRRLQWIHHWSTAITTFVTASGASYELEVTTFQLAVLFCWNDRPLASLSLETLRLATQLPDTELIRTLFSLTTFPKLRHQVLLCETEEQPPNPKRFTDSTSFKLNHAFKLVKNGREQERGRLSLVGRLQLNLENSVKQEHEEIVVLRQLRVQEAIIKVMKTRRELPLQQLECELIQLLKPMFVPTKAMVKEQLEGLFEDGLLERKTDNMDMFMYKA